MRYSKEFVGKPVYSLDEGRHLGTVRDVYVDRALAWLAGVHLGREGLLSRKSLLIARENIAVFGIDAVLAQRSDVVTDDRQAPETAQWLRLEDLIRRQVDTPAGTRVGAIGDVLLDDEARIIGFSLTRVQLEGPIAEHPVVPREALLDTGEEDGKMTIDLAAAEKYSLLALGRPAEVREAELLEAETATKESLAGGLEDPAVDAPPPATDAGHGQMIEPVGEPQPAWEDSLLPEMAEAEQIHDGEEEEERPETKTAHRIIKLPRLGGRGDERDEEI
jgi:uncharacterized protein YrrD